MLIDFSEVYPRNVSCILNSQSGKIRLGVGHLKSQEDHLLQ